MWCTYFPWIFWVNRTWCPKNPETRGSTSIEEKLKWNRYRVWPNITSQWNFFLKDRSLKEKKKKKLLSWDHRWEVKQISTEKEALHAEIKTHSYKTISESRYRLLWEMGHKWGKIKYVTLTIHNTWEYLTLDLWDQLGKVHPVVRYGCESWTIKTEHQRIDAFELWCQRRLSRVPWTARRSN